MWGPVLFVAFMALVAFVARLARAAGVVERILHDPSPEITTSASVSEYGWWCANCQTHSAGLVSITGITPDGVLGEIATTVVCGDCEGHWAPSADSTER